MNIRTHSLLKFFAFLLYVNSMICNIAILAVILLVVQGFRLSNENYFAIASIPNFVAFPLSILNLGVQLVLKTPFLRFSILKVLRKKFNVEHRKNRLSFVLSIVFILHHMNYGIWVFHLFL
jgi:hypothetical protein